MKSKPPDSPRFILPSPHGHVPPRRRNSIRRTSTVDVTWPAGRYGDRAILGIGRDIRTGETGSAPEVLVLERIDAVVPWAGLLARIDATPPLSGIQALVNKPKLRMELAALADDALRAAPSYQLIDDIPGAMVVADWAWSRWPDLLEPEEAQNRKEKLAGMEGVCTGFRPGSSALETGGKYQDDRAAAVPPLSLPSDPLGWHDVPEPGQVSLRRARCIDVWLEENLQFEAFFQDSATTPEGGRVAVHEYMLTASVDKHTRRVRSLSATPYVLPFDECPCAVDNLRLLIGAPLDEIRTLVLTTLRRELGCTHLNDVVRSLAGMGRAIETCK